jgi:hydrogenase expression/formation protein HypD
MLKSGRPDCVNMYPGAVESAGNPVALRLMEQVLEPCGCVWRGLGEIPMSGLKLRGSFERFDARRRFQVEDTRLSEPEGCLCAQILRGERVPTDCACFGGACTPDEPVGPCMVSAEGACAAYYRYKEN